MTERGKKMEKRETSFYRKKKRNRKTPQNYIFARGGGKNKITIKKNIILNLQQKGYKEQGIKVLSV